MKLRDYISQLEPEDLFAYANRCGIAESYLRIHVKYASKNPSVSLIKSLARESNGAVSLFEKKGDPRAAQFLPAHTTTVLSGRDE
eukprot:gene13548-17292_t